MLSLLGVEPHLAACSPDNVKRIHEGLGLSEFPVAMA